MIIFFKQPGLGALGQWGACSRRPASSAMGGLKTQCQGNKKKCKVNKNNSKCAYELKTGAWKLISGFSARFGHLLGLVDLLKGRSMLWFLVLLMLCAGHLYIWSKELPKWETDPKTCWSEHGASWQFHRALHPIPCAECEQGLASPSQPLLPLWLCLPPWTLLIKLLHVLEAWKGKALSKESVSDLEPPSTAGCPPCRHSPMAAWISCVPFQAQSRASRLQLLPVSQHAWPQLFLIVRHENKVV